MNITNCPACGALFVRGTRNICAKCVAAEDEQFELVKKHLDAHPEVKLDEIAESTGVDGQVILKFIRSGRLVAGRGSGFGLSCDRCGKPVVTGMVCPDCAQEMTQEIRAATRTASRSGVRMHVNRNERR